MKPASSLPQATGALFTQILTHKFTHLSTRFPSRGRAELRVFFALKQHRKARNLALPRLENPVCKEKIFTPWLTPNKIAETIQAGSCLCLCLIHQRLPTNSSVRVELCFFGLFPRSPIAIECDCAILVKSMHLSITLIYWRSQPRHSGCDANCNQKQRAPDRAKRPKRYRGQRLLSSLLFQSSVRGRGRGILQHVLHGQGVANRVDSHVRKFHASRKIDRRPRPLN